MENQSNQKPPANSAEQVSTLSKRTQLICLAISVIIYSMIIVGLNRSGWFSPSRLPISSQETLPEDYVEGKIDFSRGGRYNGSRIIVWPSNGGEIARFECQGVDWGKYKNAVPCREEGFSSIKGKLGRVWYITRVNESGLFGPEVRRLAVQLLVYPDQQYPFSVQKEALLEAQAKTSPVAIVLRIVIHMGGVLIVLIFSLPIASWLQARAKPPTSAGPL